MKKLLCLLLTAGLFFASCGGVGDIISDSDSGTICISVSENVSRTLAPELSMDPDRVTLTLSGPNGESREEELSDDWTAVITGLKYGSWSINAKAYNSDGILIGEGSADCVVSSGTITSVSLVVTSLEGEGILDIEAFWNVEDVETPVLSAVLTDCDGVERELVLTAPSDEGTARLCTNLDRGYYSLTLTLRDDDFLCTGAMEVVRIVADKTTEGSFDFTDLKINYGSIDVNIAMNLENPLTPVIGNTSELAGLSEPRVLIASVEEEIDGVSYVWFVDGQPVETGDSFTFLGETEGTYRIDLAAFSVDGARAGSTGFSLYVSEDAVSYMKISEIQGAGHTSPYAGEKLEDVLGVITAVKEKGFWIQSVTGDGDPATSEGLYIYNNYSHSYEIGDLVLVDGTVKEYGYDDCLKLTELTYVTVEVLQSDYPLPAPVVIGVDGVLPPDGVICHDSVYDGEFDPEEDAIDWYESLESMLVEIDNPVAIGGTKFGEIPVIPQGLTYDSATVRGGLIISEENYNPQRIHIDTDGETLGLDAMEADLGDYFDEPVQGVIDYSYGKFLVLPTSLPAIQSNPVTRETSGLAADEDQLTVATFNIENFPRDDEAMTAGDIEAKVRDMAETIITGLGSPDILGLQEMTDDSFSEDDGTVSAQENAARLIEAIADLGGPAYAYLEIEPEDKGEGGWPGANIRVAFLYNRERVEFTSTSAGGTYDETAVVATDGEAGLTLNPGRFSLDSFADSRKSLVAQFTFQGESVFVINNHFCSKGGDNYLFGEVQPPVLSSETERVVQAAAVRDLVKDILAVDSDANIIVVGDMNDFQFSSALETLEESGLTSLTKTLLDENEQYSYVYNGNSQQLDHILVSPGLVSGARVDIVHRYAEFDSGSRHTDHDPIVAVLNISAGTTPAGDKTLFFSEYAEGSSNNKYLEIYNPTDEAISLSDYTVFRYNNGSTDPSGTYALSGDLDSGEMYIIMNASAAESIIGFGNTAQTGATWYNGDDCLRLVDAEGKVVDQIGSLGEDPGNGWSVGGVAEGTREHTLVRKSSVSAGNGGDWISSAGIGESDSEWIVYDQDYWDDLAIHNID